MRQLADFLCIAVAFNHLTNLLLRAFYIAALTEHHAEATVTRLVIGTGQHQVTQTRHAHKGGGIGTQRCAQARHLGQTSGDQRSTCVRTKTDTVGHPSTDGNHVFHRAAQLYTDEIGVTVNAEALAAVQQLLEIVREGLVSGCQ